MSRAAESTRALRRFRSPKGWEHHGVSPWLYGAIVGFCLANETVAGVMTVVLAWRSSWWFLPCAAWTLMSYFAWEAWK